MMQYDKFRTPFLHLSQNHCFVVTIGIKKMENIFLERVTTLILHQKSKTKT